MLFVATLVSELFVATITIDHLPRLIGILLPLIFESVILDCQSQVCQAVGRVQAIDILKSSETIIRILYDKSPPVKSVTAKKRRRSNIEHSL